MSLLAAANGSTLTTASIDSALQVRNPLVFGFRAQHECVRWVFVRIVYCGIGKASLATSSSYRARRWRLVPRVPSSS